MSLKSFVITHSIKSEVQYTTEVCMHKKILLHSGRIIPDQIFTFRTRFAFYRIATEEEIDERYSN